jgi:hypothetical protein
MAHTYDGNASLATGTTVAITQPDDGDADNAAAQNTASSRLADWLQRLANLALNILSTANTWTASQLFNAGLTTGGGGQFTSGGNIVANTSSFVGLSVSGSVNTIQAPTPLVVGGSGVAFANGWTASSLASPPRYWLDAFGVVHLSGDMKNPSSGSAAAFTLPVGYRPTFQLATLLPDLQTGLMVSCVISTAGVVTVNEPNVNDVITFAGLTFETF